MAMSLSESLPATWLDHINDTSARTIIDYLTAQGTFRFPSLATGLFSAAAFESDGTVTGYGSVWTRDAVHISHALWVLGERERAWAAVEALSAFYIRHRRRFIDCIDNPGLAADPMARPHIRFNGETLGELPEKWSHAQNDALGYWLWITCRMILAEDMELSRDLADTLTLLAEFWAAIRFWEDEDSGHWEEARKVEASSIGAAVAGLKAFRNVIEVHGEYFPNREYLLRNVESLLAEGQRALHRILPNECIDGDDTQRRAHDAALLFLIYPLEVVSGPMAEQIISNVKAHLMGPIGIRRYNGDSYWCANYKTLLSEEVRTTDFSDDMSARDKLLIPGTEAQWCIFDPILSIIHARRYLEMGDSLDREQQLVHLRRSLAQLTNATSRFGAYRCPESYYLEGESWGPNDITPLLWTQANLRLALHWLQQTAG